MKLLPSCMTAALILALSGCAIDQRIERSESFSEKEICVVENPDVQSSFLEAYERVLLKRAYSVRRLPATSNLRECPITSTYTANWSWDIFLYMSYANIRIFKTGREIGSATYDSTHSGGNFGKFISAESKINELTEKLLAQEPVNK